MAQAQTQADGHTHGCAYLVEREAVEGDEGTVLFRLATRHGAAGIVSLLNRVSDVTYAVSSQPHRNTNDLPRANHTNRESLSAAGSPDADQRGGF